MTGRYRKVIKGPFSVTAMSLIRVLRKEITLYIQCQCSCVCIVYTVVSKSDYCTTKGIVIEYQLRR